MKNKMTKHLLVVCIYLSMSLFFIGCNEIVDAPVDERDLVAEAEAAKKQILELINNNEGTVIWKIEKAQLKNGRGSFDVSGNFNVLDDEFIFNKKPSTSNGRIATTDFMEWKRGDGINFKAASVQDAIQDFQLPNEKFDYTLVVPDNKAQLIAGDGKFKFEIFNDNKLKGSIFLSEENAELEVVLSKQIIEEGRSKVTFLEFEPFTTLKLSNVTGHAPDLTKSSKNNALYFSTREDSYNGRPQRVIKIDVASKEQKEVLETGFNDFVTKTSAVIQDRIYIFGAQVVWIYDLNLNLQQAFVPHGSKYTRFGMSPVKNDFYVYSISDVDKGPEAVNDVFKFDLTSLKKEKFISTSEMKTNTRGAINFDLLYIFGGSDNWIDRGDLDGFLRRINLKTNEISKSPLPFPVTRTYSGKRNHEIIYMGLTENNEKNHQVVIYDTRSNSFNVVNTNLKTLEPSPFSQAAGICILDNYLYVLFGAETPNVNVKDWTIYRTLLPL